MILWHFNRCGEFSKRLMCRVSSGNYMHVLVSSGNLSIEWKLHFISLVDHSTVY